MSTQHTIGVTFLVVGLALGGWLNQSPWVLAVRAAEEDSLQSDIRKTQKTLEAAQKKADDLQKNLSQITGSLVVTKQVIAKTASLLADTKSTITNKEAEIAALEAEIVLQKRLLEELMRSLYENGNTPLSEILLQEDDVRHAMADGGHLLTVQDRIYAIANDLAQARVNAASEKSVLEDAKNEHEKLLLLKSQQERSLALAKDETQSDLQDQQTTIRQLKEKLNTLKDEYSQILGKSVNTDDIVKAAASAAKATKMNKSFLLAVLVQESNKGKNVGGCNYKSSRMTSLQLTAFKSITKELGYNYQKQPVSCPSNAYKGTGGAMGVPQFMPATWQGYKSRIAALTGHNPPDPWSLVDGVTAMASKLSNDGAKEKTRFAEAKSYCVYLAGSNWGYYCYGSASKYRSSYEGMNCYSAAMKNYGEKVLCLKDNYEKYY